jgi:hypothetical protein
MPIISGKGMALKMKQFLELVQPLDVLYGYPRGVKSGEAFITYQDTGTELIRGIGNSIIGEWRTYFITVQTKTAEQNMYYSDFIKYGTQLAEVQFVSDNSRKDVTVEAGWINTIVLRIFNGSARSQLVFTSEEVRRLLQEIADHYLFVTSLYGRTPEESFYDSYAVQVEDRYYSLEEVLELKQEYLDKLVLNTTEF